MPTILNIPAIKERLSKEPSVKLLDILSYNQDDYEPQVIPVIKDILIERGIVTSDIEAACKTYSTVLENTQPIVKEQTSMGKVPKFMIWIMWIAGLMMLSFLAGEIKKAMLKNAVEYSK